MTRYFQNNKMQRKSKTDCRNFCDLIPKDNHNNYTQGKFHQKRKKCLCGKMFNYNHGKELYCEECKNKKN